MEIILVALLNALAFWQRHVFLYLIMCPVNIVFGLTWAATGTVASSPWVEGVIIAIIGVFFLFRVFMKLITERG